MALVDGETKIEKESIFINLSFLCGNVKNLNKLLRQTFPALIDVTKNELDPGEDETLENNAGFFVEIVKQPEFFRKLLQGLRQTDNQMVAEVLELTKEIIYENHFDECSKLNFGGDITNDILRERLLKKLLDLRLSCKCKRYKDLKGLAGPRSEVQQADTNCSARPVPLQRGSRKKEKPAPSNDLTKLENEKICREYEKEPRGTIEVGHGRREEGEENSSKPMAEDVKRHKGEEREEGKTEKGASTVKEEKCTWNVQTESSESTEADAKKSMMEENYRKIKNEEKSGKAVVSRKVKVEEDVAIFRTGNDAKNAKEEGAKKVKVQEKEKTRNAEEGDAGKAKKERDGENVNVEDGSIVNEEEAWAEDASEAKRAYARDLNEEADDEQARTKDTIKAMAENVEKVQVVNDDRTATEGEAIVKHKADDDTGKTREEQDKYTRLAEDVSNAKKEDKAKVEEDARKGTSDEDPRNLQERALNKVKPEEGTPEVENVREVQVGEDARKAKDQEEELKKYKADEDTRKYRAQATGGINNTKEEKDAKKGKAKENARHLKEDVNKVKSEETIEAEADNRNAQVGKAAREVNEEEDLEKDRLDENTKETKENDAMKLQAAKPVRNKKEEKNVKNSKAGDDAKVRMEGNALGMEADGRNTAAEEGAEEVSADDAMLVTLEQEARIIKEHDSKGTNTTFAENTKAEEVSRNTMDEENVEKFTEEDPRRAENEENAEGAEVGAEKTGIDDNRKVKEKYTVKAKAEGVNKVNAGEGATKDNEDKCYRNGKLEQDSTMDTANIDNGRIKAEENVRKFKEENIEKLKAEEHHRISSEAEQIRRVKIDELRKAQELVDARRVQEIKEARRIKDAEDFRRTGEPDYLPTSEVKNSGIKIDVSRVPPGRQNSFRLRQMFEQTNSEIPAPKIPLPRRLPVSSNLANLDKIKTATTTTPSEELTLPNSSIVAPSSSFAPETDTSSVSLSGSDQSLPASLNGNDEDNESKSQVTIFNDPIVQPDLETASRTMNVDSGTFEVKDGLVKASWLIETLNSIPVDTIKTVRMIHVKTSGFEELQNRILLPRIEEFEMELQKTRATPVLTEREAIAHIFFKKENTEPQYELNVKIKISEGDIEVFSLTPFDTYVEIILKFVKNEKDFTRMLLKHATYAKFLPDSIIVRLPRTIHDQDQLQHKLIISILDFAKFDQSTCHNIPDNLIYIEIDSPNEAFNMNRFIMRLAGCKNLEILQIHCYGLTEWIHRRVYLPALKFFYMNLRDTNNRYSLRDVIFFDKTGDFDINKIGDQGVDIQLRIGLMEIKVDPSNNQVRTSFGTLMKLRFDTKEYIHGLNHLKIISHMDIADPVPTQLLEHSDKLTCLQIIFDTGLPRCVVNLNALPKTLKQLAIFHASIEVKIPLPTFELDSLSLRTCLIDEKTMVFFENIFLCRKIEIDYDRAPQYPILRKVLAMEKIELVVLSNFDNTSADRCQDLLGDAVVDDFREFGIEKINGKWRKLSQYEGMLENMRYPAHFVLEKMQCPFN